MQGAHQKEHPDTLLRLVESGLVRDQLRNVRLIQAALE